MDRITAEAIEGVRQEIYAYVAMFPRVRAAAAARGVSAVELVEAWLAKGSRAVVRALRTGRYEYGAFTVDEDEHRVAIGGKELGGLTLTEHNLLSVLVEHGNKVCSPKFLAEQAHILGEDGRLLFTYNASVFSSRSRDSTAMRSRMCVV